MNNKPDRLLADIGGTNARFALAGAQEITSVKIYQVQDYPHLEDALLAFLAEKGGGAALSSAALAVAGPRIGDVISPTNSAWICDRHKVAAAIRLPPERVAILNDFAAIAWSLRGLKPEDFTVLQQGEAAPRQTMLVLGPGTGLGASALVPDEKQGWIAAATESGQMRYAPADADEQRIVARLTQRQGFVCAEHLISGPGLVNIYGALGEDDNGFALQPAAVVEKARGGEARARQSLTLFAGMLGNFASQTALAHIALGGVYLAGGVLQRIGADFDADLFLRRFNDHPNMSYLLARMPVMRVEADIPAFSGLQCLLSQPNHG